MTSSTGKQKITIPILFNISRSKSKQTMEFAQLLEYKMRNIFLKYHIRNVVEALVTEKKSKLSIFLDQQSEMLYSLFVFYTQVENFQNILKLRGWTLASTSHKAFNKTNRRLEPFAPSYFMHDLFHTLCSTSWLSIIVLYPLLLEIKGNVCTVIICFLTL